MRPPRADGALIATILLATLAGTGTASGQAAPVLCRHDITVLGAAATTLEIAVACDDGTLAGDLLPADPAAAAFITAQGVVDGRARFEVDLAAFATAAADYDRALRVGGSVLASPAAILPVPFDRRRAVELAITVTARDGAGIAIALPRGADGSYRLSARRIRDAGEWVFGKFTRLGIAQEGDMAVVILDGPLAESAANLQRWIADVAASNRRFWRRVPVVPAMTVILPVAGRDGIVFGRVMAAEGAVILLLLGEKARLPDLYEEWVLVHEFLHLGSPVMRDTGIWFNEGIATYFEPILRARAGWKTEEAVWREWLGHMTRGVPALTRSGLARTRQGYWGGALFLLLADVELRRRSAGRVGVEDCLAAALRAGGHIGVRWATRRMLDVCEGATGGLGVVDDLAARYLLQGGAFDLDALWRDLGVGVDADGSIRYEDAAPLAWVRRSIVWGGTGRAWAPIGTYRTP
ncbi:MAG: hypothetical protein JNL25_16495 [Rhodospirillaceae bacterium]|nr:hypothetical protein [Rhodospirillaceae bacterium]